MSSMSMSDEAKKTACEEMPYIVEQAEAGGFEPTLILSMIYVESRFEKKARSKSNACGLMQLIPKWNKEKVNGKLIKYSCEEIKEPKLNIRLGIRALNRWLKSTRSLDRALCGYNAGNICRKRPKSSDAKYIKYPSKFRYVKAIKSVQRKIKRKIRLANLK
tara:strand:- start:940 stop:1422 length:483 start_codon:yes stop_codon:yes gene_type:complete